MTARHLRFLVIACGALTVPLAVPRDSHAICEWLCHRNACAAPCSACAAPCGACQQTTYVAPYRPGLLAALFAPRPQYVTCCATPTCCAMPVTCGYGGCSTCCQPAAVVVVRRPLLFPYASYRVAYAPVYTSCGYCGSCGGCAPCSACSSCGGCASCGACSACETCPTGGCSTCAGGACGMPIEGGSSCATCAATAPAIAPDATSNPQSTYYYPPAAQQSAPTPTPAPATPPSTFRNEPTPAPKAATPSAIYQPIPALPSTVPGVNTATQPASLPRAIHPEDKTAMDPPAATPTYYLVSAAQKIASPAPAAVPAAVTSGNVTVLDDSGWRPARD